MKNDYCQECGAPLTSKELMSRDILGVAVCDICIGRAQRVELAKDGYKQRLRTVPQIYADTKYGDDAVAPMYQKSAVILAEESPVTGTQWLWDVIKYYWRAGQNAVYASIKDIAIEYASLPWQSKNETLNRIAATPGMLAIDDIDHGAPREVLERIIEHRAERGLDTIVVIHIPYDELGSIIGDKAGALVAAKWKCLSMERP